METVVRTKAELDESVGRMLALMDATPDDKLFWNPSPSARSIGEIAAHAAHALENITSQMRGEPFPIPTSSDANRMFREHDRAFTDRQEVRRLLEEMRSAYDAFLDSLTPKDLDRTVPLPFGLGEWPLREFIGAGPMHTRCHNAQIEYIQTLYGDQDWHWGF
ncbi:MAG: DinB family protein [Fimbriimonadaceae bacterium]|nr:DinB family protein [Fimbriimonadaceae bacterium]QYK58938.1 MAG: DinB family protein [Fimbriimonadaceae bacterium]